MRIGVFADTHDHLDHIEQLVEIFNARQIDLAVFAGDFVSSIALPPLRKLKSPLIACYGDNEGNKPGVAAGMRILGTLGEPPFGFQVSDGTRFVLCHMTSQLTNATSDCEVVIYAHTHRAAISYDPYGRLYVNPGEASGWTYRRPSIALIETAPLSAEIIWLESAQRPKMETPLSRDKA